MSYCYCVDQNGDERPDTRLNVRYGRPTCDDTGKSLALSPFSVACSDKIYNSLECLKKREIEVLSLNLYLILLINIPYFNGYLSR